MSRILKKTMAVIIICVILAFTLFAVFSINWTSTALQAALEDKAYYEATKCSNQISMIFENAEGTVDALAADIRSEFDINEMETDPEYNNAFIVWHEPIIAAALKDIEDSQGLYVTFNPDLTNHEGVHEIWYSYDKNGEIVVTDPSANGIYQEAFLDIDAPNMAYYFAAIKNPRSGVWTDPAFDPDLEVSTLAYSRAIFVDGILVGVIGTDISTDHTTDLIRNMNVANKGEVFLLNSNRELIVSSVKNNAEENKYSKEINAECADEMRKHENGTMHVVLNGKKTLVSYSTLSNDWMLSTVITESELMAPINFITTIIIILSICLASMSIFLAYWALKKYSSPVDKATEILKMMELESQVYEADKEKIQNDDDIEALVQKAANRQRSSDIVMAHQAKLIQAGEMVNNIAHQWKQPLNNINIILGNLRDDARYGELTEDAVIQAVDSAEELVGTMSATIDDFGEYLKPGGEMEQFSVEGAVNAVLKLVKDKLRANNIIASFEYDKDLGSYGYKNALYHVVLNIVNNAIEALKHSNQSNYTHSGNSKKIIIHAHRILESKSKIAITIFNNGMSISEDVKSNLFTPYFTTKSKNEGTGLGLAISKNLVETSMGGSISLDNVEDGVQCTIIINEGEKSDKQ